MPRLRDGICYFIRALIFQRALFIITTLATTVATQSRTLVHEDTENARQLRIAIFPTLYAVFQRSEGRNPCNLKIKNRSLRSLLRSCLYATTETQLTRTKADAEALLQRYCITCDV